MNWKDRWALCHQVVKGRKKFTKRIVALLVSATVIYLLVNIFLFSLEQYEKKMVETPSNLAQVELFSEVKSEEEIANEIEEYKKYPEIVECYQGYSGVFEGISSEDEDLKKIGDLFLGTFNQAFQKYSDTKDLKECEALVPKKLIYNQSSLEYMNGKQFVGKTMEFTYQYQNPITYENIGSDTISLKIVGTYDSILTSEENTILINPKTSAEILNKISEKEQGVATVEEANEYSYGWKNGAITLVFKDNASLTALKEQGVVANGRGLIKDQDSMRILNLITGFGILLSLLLYIICFVNVLIFSLRDTKERMGEFSLQRAMGYEKKDLYINYFLEYVILLLKSLPLSALFVIAGICIFKFFYYKTYGVFASTFTISVDLASIFSCLLLLVVSLFFSGFFGFLSMRKLSVVEGLRYKE